VDSPQNWTLDEVLDIPSSHPREWDWKLSHFVSDFLCLLFSFLSMTYFSYLCYFLTNFEFLKTKNHVQSTF
jgi:hypothetical protein